MYTCTFTHYLHIHLTFPHVHVHVDESIWMQKFMKLVFPPVNADSTYTSHQYWKYRVHGCTRCQWMWCKCKKQGNYTWLCEKFVLNDIPYWPWLVYALITVKIKRYRPSVSSCINYVYELSTVVCVFEYLDIMHKSTYAQ